MCFLLSRYVAYRFMIGTTSLVMSVAQSGSRWYGKDKLCLSTNSLSGFATHLVDPGRSWYSHSEPWPGSQVLLSIETVDCLWRRSFVFTRPSQSDRSIALMWIDHRVACAYNFASRWIAYSDETSMKNRSRLGQILQEAPGRWASTC